MTTGLIFTDLVTYTGIVLTRRHSQQHLRWARQRVIWTRAVRGAVLLTYESRFNLRRSVWGEGSVMIWAGFSQTTKPNALVIVGNLNAARYETEILRPVAIPHIQ